MRREVGHDPIVTNDPKYRAPLWDVALPNELVLYRGTGPQVSCDFLFTNEPPDRLIAKDSRCFPIEKLPQGLFLDGKFSGGFVGFGSNAVLDWADNASHLVHADISEEVLKTAHYLFRPLILIAESGRELFNFLLGFELGDFEQLIRALVDRNVARGVASDMRLGNKISVENFDTWAKNREQTLGTRDIVITRSVEQGLDEVTIDTLYRYTSLMYGLEAPEELASPLSPRSLHTRFQTSVASWYNDVARALLQRYLLDQEGLTIVNNRSVFEACKERYQRGQVRYIVGDAFDPTLYIKAREYFASEGVECFGVFTSNIQMNDPDSLRLIQTAEKVSQGNAVVYWGFRDGGSNELQVAILPGR